MAEKKSNLLNSTWFTSTIRVLAFMYFSYVRQKIQSLTSLLKYRVDYVYAEMEY